MDYTTRELLKRYTRMALGQPFAPVLLNILVTSVCDMRCTHCFFTDELDDRPRKKLQMKTHEIEKISETLGGNLGVLILAGGEPFTRKDLPEVVRAFYKNNRLESVYLMSNGQIQKRIMPDVTRILEECPNLNVTVALGIDGLKEQHEKIRQKHGSWDIAIDTARQLQTIPKTKEEQKPQRTCYAGTAAAVIYDEGTLSSCENLEPIENQRKYDWDFQKLGLSPAMKERRKHAANGCYCTHESNCYYPSLPFNPKHLIQIKRLEKEMKKASKALGRESEQADGVSVKV